MGSVPLPWGCLIRLGGIAPLRFGAVPRITQEIRPPRNRGVLYGDQWQLFSHAATHKTDPGSTETDQCLSTYTRGARPQVVLTEQQLADLRRSYEDRLSKHRDFAARLEQLLHGLLDNAVAEIYEISTRCKDVESFLDKAIRKGFDQPLHQVRDQIGARVVVLFEADVDEVVSLLQRHMSIPVTSIDDKRRGSIVAYEAVHLVTTIGSQRFFLPEWEPYRGLLFEIQVRSLLSHTWSEVSHRLNYKQPLPLPAAKDKDLQAAVGALRWVDTVFNDLRDLRREMDSAIEQTDGLDE